MMQRHEHPDVVQVQSQAVREAMEAKRDFEIDQQTAKVRALAEQVEGRLDNLNALVYSTSTKVRNAVDQPVFLTHGAFGDDTGTIDALLTVLAEESAVLDNMRRAREKTISLAEKFDAQIAELAAEAATQQEQGGQPHLASVGGQYL